MPIRDINIASNANIATTKLASDSGLTGSHIASSAVLDRHLSVKLRTGVIPLDISLARVVGSTSAEAWANATAAVGTPGAGFLSSATSPVYTVNSTLARVGRLQFSSAAATLIQFPNIVIPPDLSTTSTVTVHAIGGSAGSTDAGPLFNFHFYSNGGSSNAAVALTMSSAAASTVAHEVSTTVPAAYISSHPGVLTVMMGVTSTADVMYAHAMWLEYTRNSTA